MESGRKREKICNNAKYFEIEKGLQGGKPWKRGDTREGKVRKAGRLFPLKVQYAHAHVSRSLGRTSPVTFLSVINVEREERALGSRIDQ